MERPLLSNFLDLPPELSDPGVARYGILQAPYEGTVSYKNGTAGGPQAIIEASAQVEWFDEELGDEFHTAGIATYPIVHPDPNPAGQMQRVKDAAREVLKDGKFLLALGGEHSMTAGLVAAVAEMHGPISVLQIDAHADLRDSYGGTKHSHACVMRRVLETAKQICQVGIRSYSREEKEACSEQVANFITPQVIEADPAWIDRVLGMLGEKVYITVDMDGLDPSIAPGVGTPEPGGLTWAQVTGLLRRVCTERQVVAADVVEARPLADNHVTECLAARLAYKIIAYTQLHP